MKWVKACEIYKEQLSIGWEALEEMDKSEVKKKCREMNDKEWRRSTEKKESLKYRR